MRDRGQTEVLGYVLVFSLIVLTVALVTVSGQAGLAELQDNRRTANVESGFVTLAENVDDIVHDGAPSRATELALSGERVALGDPVTVTVTAESSGTTEFDRSRSLTPIVYRGDDGAELAYAAGAVVGRSADGGAVMLRAPRFLLGPDRTVVPIVNTSLDREQLRGRFEAVDRESRVLVRTKRTGVRVLNATDGPVDLTVSVTSPRAAAWEESLDEIIDPGSDDCSLSGDTATCTYETDRVVVSSTRIAVRLD